MNLLSTISFLLVVQCMVVHCMEPSVVMDGGDDGKDLVMVLTKENFDDAINENENILVEFYAPWCGHCKSFEPSYKTVARLLQHEKPPIPVAKIDATEATEIANKYQVTGYPTIIFFKNGKNHVYDLARDTATIVNTVMGMAKPDWTPPEDETIELTDDTFTDFVNEHPLSLVEFYAPWCGHCKQLAPQYESAARSLVKHDPPIPLAKIDATEHQISANKYEVQGYPTLKVFRKGKAYDYKGDRNVHSIVHYMEQQHKPPSELLETAQEAKEFFYEEKQDIAVVGYFNSKEDSMYELFMAAAEDKRGEFSIGHTFSEQVQKHYKAKANTVVLYKPKRYHTDYEENSIVFTEDDKDYLKSKISENRYPLVGHLQLTNEDVLYRNTDPLAILFYDVDFEPDHVKETQMYRKKLAAIAKDFPGIYFAVANDERMTKWVQRFNFDDGAFMTFGIISENRNYPMEGMDTFDADAIRNHLKNFKQGNLEPIRRSGKLPKENKGIIKTVVSLNFDSIVRDSSKEAVLLIHEGKCVHECKSLEKAMKDAAKTLKNKRLVFGKMNANLNDIPKEYVTDSLPAVLFAGIDNKNKPSQFEPDEEEVDAKSIISFIEEHATVLSNKKTEL